MAAPVELPAPPGYGRVVALDRERHAGLGIDTAARNRFAHDQHLLYLTSEEFFQAALDYPIAFVAEPDGAGVVPAVLLGLEPGRNLFVDAAGRWLPGHYVPAVVRRYPLCVVRVQGTGGVQRLIAVDEGALVASDAPLFTPGGNETAAWRSLQALVDQLEGAHERTLAFCQALAEAGLLVPFEVRVRLADGRSLHVAGLQRVDEERLKQLPSVRVMAWFADGTLARIHAHLLSVNHLARFPDRCV
jgi:hypothetical protein